MSDKERPQCHCATLPHRVDCPVVDSHIKSGGGVALLCDHPPKHVTADILEGEGGSMGVRWCRQCGAYQRTFNDGGRCGEWRESTILHAISKELQQ